MAVQAHVDAILCLGDLDRAWIETIAAVPVPRVGVHGNHDEENVLRELEVDDLHLRRTALCGLTFAGFEGCVRYSSNSHYQYTQKQAAKMIKKLPAADVLICHCPPLGVNDDPTDPAHVGWEALRDWVERHEPKHLLHGHTHPMPGQTVSHLGPTRVHYVSGGRVLTLD